jgi:hypothetical protein
MIGLERAALRPHEQAGVDRPQPEPDRTDQVRALALRSAAIDEHEHRRQLQRDAAVVAVVGGHLLRHRLLAGQRHHERVHAGIDLDAQQIERGDRLAVERHRRAPSAP